MIHLVSVLFIGVILVVVRYYQRKKQTYLLQLEEELGFPISTERKERERERIRINLILVFASIPFAGFPFLCFFLFMDTHISLKLSPVFVFTWGMIYFWFATEHFNVFRKNITYGELLTRVEKNYFKNYYSPFVHSHEILEQKYLETYIKIRENIREYIELTSERHCHLSKEELEAIRIKIDELCWEINREKEKGHRK